jgi:hypothetical protein
MSEYVDPISEASDPATTAARLAELAHEHPETRPWIAVHPNVYDGLLEWMALYPVETEPQPVPESYIEPEPEPAPAIEPLPAASPRKHLSTGAKVGIGAGALVAVLFFTAIGVAASVGHNERVAADELAAQEQAEFDALAEAEAERQQEIQDELDAEAAAAAEAEAERVREEQAALAKGKGAWKFANESGFSYTLSFATGTPVRPTGTVTHPSDSEFVAGSICGVDPDTDVVIPVTLRATATTKGYATNISASFILNSGGRTYDGNGIDPFQGDDRVDIEQDFTAGGECTSVSSTNIWGYGQPDAISVKWEDPIEEGASVSHELFVIVHDYYLPVHPKGDKALLDYIAILPIFGGSNADIANTFNPVNNDNGMYSAQRLSLNGKLFN